MSSVSFRTMLQRAANTCLALGRAVAAEGRRSYSDLLDVLDLVRSSPRVRLALARLERRVGESRAGSALERFLGMLDQVALWLEPRVQALDSWMRAATREEKAALAATALAVLFLGERLSSLPTPGLPAPRVLEVSAFFENGWGGAFPSSMPSLRRQVGPDGRGVDAIYPVWHTVLPDGTLESAVSEEALGYCRANGVAVMPVVTNARVPGGDNSGVLRNPRAAAAAVSAVVREVERRGYDGLNLSFQLVSPHCRRALTSFATDLSVAMKDRGRAFVVSVFPDVETSPEVSGAYDYAALGRVADAVVLMAYDRHWTGSGAGPVAPLEWVDTCVRRVARYVPVSRLILGLGSYGYDWPDIPRAGKAEYIPAPAAAERAAAQGASAAWDRESMERVYRYSWGGVPRTVRFMDNDAVRLRAGIARRYGLRGVAYWRLGFEESPDGVRMSLSSLR